MLSHLLCAELEVYINGFEESLVETQRLRASVQERIHQLQSSLYQEDGGLARDAHRLLTSFEREFTAFSTLEKRFDAVGSAAIRAGQQVERLRGERLRAMEAQELVKMFVEVSGNPEAMVMRLSDAVLSGPTLGHCREAVVRLRRLQSLGRALQDRVTPACSAAISEASQRVENGLLERFHAAFDADDRVAMRAPAALLISFSGGASVIGSFVSKHVFFLDPVLAEHIHSRYRDPALQLDMNAPEPVDPVIEERFKALVDTVEEDWRFILDVFVDSPALVMDALLTRIIQEPVQVTVEAVLAQARAHSPFAFLRALAATRAAAKRLASDLCKALQDRQGAQLAPIEALLDGLFSPYLPQLLGREMEAASLLLDTCFQPVAAALKARRSAARLPSFLRSSKAEQVQAPPAMDTDRLRFADGTLLGGVSTEEGAPPVPAVRRCLVWTGEALTRLYALLPEEQRGAGLERLYTAVYSKTGDMLASCLDTCLELSEGADTARLHVAAAATSILSALQLLHQSVAAPLLVTAAPPSFRVAVLLKDRLFTSAASKIDALLRAEVAAWLGHIQDNLLAKQRSSDFKPRDDEITMGTTQVRTCIFMNFTSVLDLHGGCKVPEAGDSGDTGNP